MPLTARTESALEACADAILAPERWGQALQLLAESFGAASCTFFTPGRDSPRTAPVSTAHEEFADIWRRNQAEAPDPHNVCHRSTYTGRAVTIEHQFSSEEDRRTAPYYRLTARPGKREWFAQAYFMVDGRDWFLPLYRGADRGPFTLEEARAIAQVRSPLSRIISMAEKFTAATERSKLCALEQVRCAAMLIDDRGRVRQMNALAQALIGDDFNLTRGRPAARDPTSNRRLQSLVGAAIVARRGGATLAPAVIAREGAPWLLVEAMPATEFGGELFAPARTILLLTDLTSPQRPDAALLNIAFGLTAAEARLASHMASGAGIDTAAASLGVSRETVRSQLKAVFAKTNTRGQAELAGILARLRPSTHL